MIPIGLHSLFTARQAAQFAAWDRQQIAKALVIQNVKQVEDLHLRGFGLRTFSVTPIDDGVIIEIRNNITGKVLTLHDD